MDVADRGDSHVVGDVRRVIWAMDGDGGAEDEDYGSRDAYDQWGYLTMVMMWNCRNEDIASP